jgi:phosphosulfolactate synthase (CoM biosynthesis protein A)
MAGRLLGLLVNLIVFPCVAGAVGYTFVDKLSPYVNAMNLPMDAVNTMTNLRLIFAAGCFLFVFFLIWNHMAQSQNETDMTS